MVVEDALGYYEGIFFTFLLLKCVFAILKQRTQYYVIVCNIDVFKWLSTTKISYFYVILQSMKTKQGGENKDTLVNCLSMHLRLNCRNPGIDFLQLCLDSECGFATDTHTTHFKILLDVCLRADVSGRVISEEPPLINVSLL